MCAERARGSGLATCGQEAALVKMLGQGRARLLIVDHIADVSYALPPQVITTDRSPSHLDADDPRQRRAPPDCRDVRLVRDD